MSTETEQMQAVLEPNGLESVFQPIVSLADRRVVGYEALSRGPAGTAFADPSKLFAAAREQGRLGEVCWACRGAALRRAIAHGGFDGERRLFLNVEPETLAGSVPEALRSLWATAHDELSVVLEITERALTADPAGLLQSLAAVRDRGWGVALDDVGADLHTLALLPLVRPDVIKLDMSIVQNRPTADLAAIVSAVTLEREQTGAIVLAEGVETEEHVETALALGATLAQGFLFGCPRPLPEPLPEPGPALRLLPRTAPYGGASPFELLARDIPPQRARKPLLLAMSEHLERQAIALGAGALVVGTFEAARYFGPKTADRYQRLADSSAFVAAFAPHLDEEEMPDNVRGGHLDDSDGLAGMWNVIVIGHHFGAVLAAREHDPPGAAPEDDRRFDFILTHDRILAVESARIVMGRVSPVSLRPALGR